MPPKRVQEIFVIITVRIKKKRTVSIKCRFWLSSSFLECDCGWWLYIWEQRIKMGKRQSFYWIRLLVQGEMFWRNWRNPKSNTHTMFIFLILNLSIKHFFVFLLWNSFILILCVVFCTSQRGIGIESPNAKILKKIIIIKKTTTNFCFLI